MSNPSGDHDPPPAYYKEEGDRPVDTSTPSGPPPSYDSLYGRFQQARGEADNDVDFSKKAYTKCCNSFGLLAIIIPSVCLSISNIVMGAIYFNDCPADKQIPMYLVVQGPVNIIWAIVCVVVMCLKPNDEDEEDPRAVVYLSRWSHSLNLFLFVWFIVGNVNVYRLHGNYQSNDPLSDNYCDETLYTYAFWIITLPYIITAAFILLSCCCLVCLCSTPKNEVDAEAPGN